MSDAEVAEGTREETEEQPEAAPGPDAPDATPLQKVKGEPRLFDFRRPQKFSRDHVRALEIVHETFARQVTTILSTTLRAVSQVQLVGVEESSYGEYVESLPNPTVLTIVSADPLPGVGALHLPLSLAMSAVDRILGGTGTGTLATRPLTDIEEGLVRGQIERWLAAWADSFSSLSPIEPKIVNVESNPQFAQIAAPSDMVMVITFEIHIGTSEGAMSLCLPFGSLQPVLDRIVGPSMFIGGSVDAAEAARAVAGALEDVSVDVSVRFNTVTLASRDILGLREGDVLPLHHPIGAPLTMTAAGHPVLKAMAGRRGKRLACVVVGDDAERKR